MLPLATLEMGKEVHCQLLDESLSAQAADAHQAEELEVDTHTGQAHEKSKKPPMHLNINIQSSYQGFKVLILLLTTYTLSCIILYLLINSWATVLGLVTPQIHEK